MKLELNDHELCQTPHMDALHLMGEHKVGLKRRAKYCSSSTESADTAGKLMCPFVCLELRINYTMGTSSELQALAVIKVQISIHQKKALSELCPMITVGRCEFC